MVVDDENTRAPRRFNAPESFRQGLPPTAVERAKTPFGIGDRYILFVQHPAGRHVFGKQEIQFFVQEIDRTVGSKNARQAVGESKYNAVEAG